MRSGCRRSQDSGPFSCRAKLLRATNRTRLLDRAGTSYPPPTKAQPGSSLPLVLCSRRWFLVCVRRVDENRTLRGVQHFGRDTAESHTPRYVEPAAAHGEKRSLRIFPGRLQQGCYGLAHGDPDVPDPKSVWRGFRCYRSYPKKLSLCSPTLAFQYPLISYTWDGKVRGF